MADGRYGKLKVYKDGAWVQPREVKVYKGGQWHSFGNNLDTVNTNNLQVRKDLAYRNVLQRYYTRTENTGMPYVYTNSDSHFLNTIDNNSDGFQVGPGFSFECIVEKTADVDTQLLKIVSSSWNNPYYEFNKATWAFMITWLADGRIKVDLKWGNVDKGTSGDWTRTSNVRRTKVNGPVHLHVWCSGTSGAYTMQLNIQFGYGDWDSFSNLSASYDGKMRNWINPTGYVKFTDNLKITYRYSGADRSININCNNLTSSYVAKQYSGLYRGQNSQTVGYWA